jgi:predicted nucleic-acid-binding protein
MKKIKISRNLTEVFNEKLKRLQESIKPTLDLCSKEIVKTNNNYSLEFESQKAFLNKNGYMKPKDFEEFLWWFMEKNENDTGYIFPLPMIEIENFREFSEFKTSRFFNNSNDKPINIKNEYFIGFYKYDFNNLDKISGKADYIINHLSQNDIPYIVAYLKLLEFDKFLLENYCKTKENMYLTISKILKKSKRIIKGNYLVLNPKSNEDRIRYTSHKYINQVSKHYKSIKLGV